MKIRAYNFLVGIFSFVFAAFPGFLCGFIYKVLEGAPFLAISPLRVALLKSRGAKIGDSVLISHNVEIRSPECLVVGDRVSIQRGCYIDAVGGVSIGNDVSIAHGCSILSFDHDWSNYNVPIRENRANYSPVSIGNDVWIGCQCILLSGSVLGTRCIVAAGSVITRKLLTSEGALIAGTPGKLVKRICLDE